MPLPAALVRWITYPLHERLRHRPTLAELRELLELLAQPAAAVAQETDARLRQLLVYAGSLSFYARRFASVGLNPHTHDPRAELARLSVLRKHDVRAHAREMANLAVPGGVVRCRSGGTSGDTLELWIDRLRQAQPLAARLCMQARFGVPLGAPRVYFWGSPIENRRRALRRWRDRLLNETLLDAFDLAPERLSQHLHRLESAPPAVIYGYPSALAALARHAVETGRRRCVQPRLIVLTGEEVRPDDAALVGDVFACRVAQEYGSREVGLIAHDCPRGRLHVLSPHVLVEVLVGGTATAPGETGEIVCTTLGTRAQPLLRYALGDAGQLPADECPCGLPLPLLHLVGGKITGLLALPDGRRCHAAITSHVLRDLPGIVQFKTIQHGMDAFEVLLVVNDDFRPGTSERIRARYRGLFGPAVHVEIRQVACIPPDPSGKRRYFISQVTPAGVTA